MSRPNLRIVSSQAGPAAGQIHSSNAFGRRRRAAADAVRADLPQRWQRLMGHLFGYGPGARSDTAVEFAVTLQTACNWHDGAVSPSGAAVAYAWSRWPDDCTTLLADGPVLRAVA